MLPINNHSFPPPHRNPGFGGISPAAVAAADDARAKILRKMRGDRSLPDYQAAIVATVKSLKIKPDSDDPTSVEKMGAVALLVLEHAIFDLCCDLMDALACDAYPDGTDPWEDLLTQSCELIFGYSWPDKTDETPPQPTRLSASRPTTTPQGTVRRLRDINGGGS